MLRFPPTLARLLIAATLAFAPGLARAQARSPSELEGRLPALTGVERARVLAQLVDAYKLDHADRAVAYGAEALRLLDQAPDTTARLLTLNELVWAHMSLGHYDTAAAFGDSAYALARRAHDRAAEARALSNLGSLAQRVGEPQRAVDLFREALTIQRALHTDREAANSLNNLGFVYSTDLAQYDSSLSMHLEALAIRERMADSAAIALSLNNIGIVYGRLRQYQRATTYFQRSLAIRRAIGSHVSGQQARIGATLHNLGDMYLERGEPRSALRYHLEALRVRETVGDRSQIALSHSSVGAVYRQMGRLETARAELVHALQMSDSIGDRGLAVRTRLGLASVERADGNLAEAERLAGEALARAQAMGSRELVRRASEELAAAQESRGQLQTALNTLRRSKAVSDSIFSAETSRRLADLERRYGEERRAREIDRLKRDQAELRAAASERAVQRNLVAGFAVLALTIGFGLYRRRVERERLAASLSVTDALTGVKNRRYLQQTIDADVAVSLRRHRTAAARGDAPDDADLVFYLVDIDNFKRINDELGHTVGDRVLAEIARVLQAAARDSDAVVRWGGEEFLVLGRFTDRSQAPVAAERFRQAVSSHVISLDKVGELRLTCSVGFAAFPFDLSAPDALTWQSVVTLADLGTLAAKRAGRDAWVGHASTGVPIAVGQRVVLLPDLDEWVRAGAITRHASLHGVPSLSIDPPEKAVARES